MIPWLDPRSPDLFPDVRLAVRTPNGLLAAGGDLSAARLVGAYRRGIFPWFNEGDPILWWSPDPRTVLFPSHIALSHSLRKRLRKQALAATMDRAFDAVIRGCAASRGGEAGGTWIVPSMIAAYEELHRKGFAHSVEIWRDSELVGGLYGVAIGGAFFGESMFSRANDASKVALVHLCQRLVAWDFRLIDCQMRTEHLIRMGATEIARGSFVALVERCCAMPGRTGSWNDGVRHYPLDRMPDRPGETAR